MKTRPGLVILWFIAGIATWLAPCATAQQQRADAQPGGGGAWAMQAPASSEMIIEVRDAAHLRATPVGRALHDLMSRAGLLAETRSSWDALAKTLGWAREEAFDQLLGDRLMIVISGVTGETGAPVRWAVLSRVNEQTDKRLLEKLAAAPRGTAAGHQLLSVEDGQYELAVHRPPGGGPGGRVIVLGPHQRPELFDRVLRSLNDAPEPGEVSIFATPAATGLAELGDADAMILVRMELENPKDAKAATDSWSAYAAVALRTDDAGVGLRCVVSDPTAASLLNSEAGGPAIDLDAAFTGALIATAEHRLAKAAFEPDSPLTELLAKVRMPEPLQRSLATGQMFVAQASPAPPGVAMGLAIHMTDPIAAARDADAFMAGLVRLIEGEPQGGKLAPIDFAGVAPRAVRTVPVDAWSSFPWLEWPEVWVSWSFEPSPAPSALKPADPILGNGAGTPGWWVIGVAGGKAEEVGAGRALANDVVSQLHAAAPPEERGRVLSQGVVRPAALAKAVWPGVPDLGSWREVFGRVSVVRWRFDAADGGRIDGTVRVDLTSLAPVQSVPAPAGGTAR